MQIEGIVQFNIDINSIKNSHLPVRLLHNHPSIRNSAGLSDMQAAATVVALKYFPSGYAKPL